MITYEDIINDFNQRGEVYEGTHSLINFAYEHYPEQFEAFCEMVDKIADTEEETNAMRKMEETKMTKKITYQICFWSCIQNDWILFVECETEDEAKGRYAMLLNTSVKSKLAIFEKEETIKYRKLDYLEHVSDKWIDNCKKELKQCFKECRKQDDAWYMDLMGGYGLEICVDRTPGKEDELSYFISLGHDDASKVADQYTAYCAIDSYDELERTVFAYLGNGSRLLRCS